jgi:hypothetical protein
MNRLPMHAGRATPCRRGRKGTSFRGTATLRARAAGLVPCGVTAKRVQMRNLLFSEPIPIQEDWIRYFHEQRVLRAGGVLAAVIPCEGGFAYRLGRRLTTQRVFERRYGVPYDWHVRAQHPNRPGELFEEIAKRFAIRDRTFFPLRVPIVHANLVIGITATLLPEGNHARVIGSSRS